MTNMMNQLELQFWNFLIPVDKKKNDAIISKPQKMVLDKPGIFMMLSSSSLGLVIGVLLAIFVRVI